MDMADLNFSAIGDTSGDIEELTRLVKEFQNELGARVNIARYSWERAWQTLLMIAMEGKGGDASQVGSTWAPTLAALDSLRSFSEMEVRSFGGPLIFVPAAWQTVSIEGRSEVWAIPWSVYTFVIYYRRDLLQKAGIDEAAAFATTETMRETFKTLQEAGIIPWTIPLDAHYLDLPHIASAWARSNGGDFIAPDGSRAVFNTPHARSGLVDFFALYRFIPPQLRNLDYEGCLNEFFQNGKTAVLIGGAEAYTDASLINAISEKVRDRVGVASVPGTPWIGGDHLVVWKTVRADHEKEKAAVGLIRSLTSVENQIRIHRETRILPARLDAYPDLEFQPDGMRSVLERVLQIARPHPPARLWRRIESMLVDMLGDIAHSVLENRTQSVEEIVAAKLADYENRFTLILGK